MMLRALFTFLVVAVVLMMTGRAQAMCGDCNEDCSVTVDELMHILDSGLDGEEFPACGDCDESGLVGIGDMVIAVENALGSDPTDPCLDDPASANPNEE
jgi:hypothetical protein